MRVTKSPANGRYLLDATVDEVAILQRAVALLTDETVLAAARIVGLGLGAIPPAGQALITTARRLRVCLAEHLEHNGDD